MIRHIFSIIALLSTVSLAVMAESVSIKPSVVTRIQKGEFADAELYDPNATSWTTNLVTISNGAFVDQLSNYGGSEVVLFKTWLGELPSDITVTKATLTFNSKCTVESRNSQLVLAQVNPDIDYTIMSWNSDNNSSLNAAHVADMFYSNSTETTKQSADVTDIVSNLLKAGKENIGLAVYTKTGRQQMVSDFVINVEYRKGELKKYSYRMNAVDAEGTVLKTLVEGEAFEGEEHTLCYPRMVQADGKYYMRITTDYAVKVGCDTTVNLEYQAYDRDIRYYCDVETYSGGSAYSGMYSNGYYGYVEGGKTLELTTLPAGVYTFYASFIERGDRGIYIRDAANTDVTSNVIAFFEMDRTTTAGMKTMSFHLSKDTRIGLSGWTANNKTNQSAGIDYVYIVRTGDYIPPLFPRDASESIPAEWVCAQGDGPTLYEGASEAYTTSAYNEGKVIYQRIEGLQPGKYKVDFYAAANMMFFGAAYGPNIAQVYCNGEVIDVPVINQTGCKITDYPRSFTVTTTDGVIEYGIQNKSIGGNWYVCQSGTLTQLDSLTVKEQLTKTLVSAYIVTAKVMNASVKEQLDAVIASTVGYGSKTNEEIEELLFQMRDALDVAQKSVDDYAATIAAYTTYSNKANDLDSLGKEYFYSNVETIMKEYDDRVLDKDMAQDILNIYMDAQDAQEEREPVEVIGTMDMNTEYDMAHSELMAVEHGQTLHYEFENFTPQDINYNSWVLVVKPSQIATNYSVILRNDSWENVSRSSTNCYNNFNWETYLSDMNGSLVSMDITYLNGKVSMKSVITTADGLRNYTYTYQKNGFTQNVLFMYLTNLNSYQKIYKVSITGEPIPVAVDAIDADATDAPHVMKMMRGRQMIIRNGNREYDASGRQMK